jgi:ATPase family associated with various cellular activities (AAA)/Winged helix domain, variant
MRELTTLDLPTLDSEPAPLPSFSTVLLSCDGRSCAAIADGFLRVNDAEVRVANPVAAAMLDQEVWLIARDGDRHQLRRFDLAGTSLAPAAPLGALGDTVSFAAARQGGRHALVEGSRALELRVCDGPLTTDDLGARGRDARVLWPGRGVVERRGGALVLRRAGATTQLALPPDTAAAVVVGGTLMMDGSAALTELEARGHRLLLLHDLRSGGLRARIRIGQAAVMAVAEQRGVVVIGRDRHLALIDLTAGRVVCERVFAAPVRAVAVDASGQRFVTADEHGELTQLGPNLAPPAAAPAPAAPPVGESAPPAEPSAEAAPIVSDDAAEPSLDAIPLLLALRPRRQDHEEWEREAIGEYLACVRRWVAALCRTALAVACDEGRSGAVDPAERVEALLVPRAGRAPERVAEARAAEAVASEELARYGGVACPHVELARDLGLSPTATSVLLLAAAPQIWGELARVYAMLAADPARALVDELLLCELLEADSRLRAELARELDPEGPLVRVGAIQLGPQPRPYASITVHPVVVRRLVGERFALDEADGRAPALKQVIAPRPAVAALVAALTRDLEAPARVVVRGRSGAGRRTLSRALAAAAGRVVAPIDLAPSADAVEAALVRALRDANLRGFLPCVSLDELTEDPPVRARVRAVLDAHPGPLFVRGPIGQPLPLAAGYHAIDLPPLDETARRAAWAGSLAARDLPVDVGDRLAARFAVGPGVIEHACDHPSVAAASDDARERALADAVRQQHSARLGTIAQRVERLARWEDLILPDDLIDNLCELLARVAHRHTVLDVWGMGRVATTARGVTALFQGAPGTGKTMAAGVLARALGYELWRVDLSKVMSRWIGETEKNLDAVLDAAEDGEVILLFDEADSLFGKRTEVKSSHDRYANLEVNHLLQRLDSFGGVALLATNFGTAIDPAFKRRISLHVQFPFPDVTDRERLWRAHLPAKVPLAGPLDLATLAQRFELSGALIRNAALRAAYLAAEEGGAVTQAHLIRAVSLEYEARGRISAGRLE